MRFASLGQVGLEPEALDPPRRRLRGLLLRRDPTWSLERAARLRSYKNAADTERDLDALRKAGRK
jgi:hypothetical protein